LKGIGAKSEEKLAKHGITTIKAICDLTPEKIKEISDAAIEVKTPTVRPS
jgi:predicted flap endonuclease-1-like 5' DNA nuclease